MYVQNICIYKNFYCYLISSLLLLFATALTAQAQENTPNAVVQDFHNVFTSTMDKAIQLAEAIPEEEYDWRPAEEVRSVREVVLHVAGASYFFGSMLGVQIPDDVNPQAMEQSGLSKMEAIDALKKSVSFTKNFLESLSEEELNSKIDFFGNEVTKRQAMIVLGGHASEHLGQLIAYARMNGVTPPWSQS
jgi:uncharacterized damage-inducible protein DinB